MIIPIGHDESATRRWPWVTFALAALCALVFLGTDASVPAPPDPEEALGEAASYWREHAYLDAAPEVLRDVGYDVPPNQRSQYLALLKDQSWDDMPEDPEQVEAQQAKLDRLTERALSGPAAQEGVAADHPYWRFGLVPGSAGLVTLVSHQFLHGGWLHLIGNLFLLLLIAPAIEDRWGRPLFLAFYLVGGAAGGLMHLAMNDQRIPMIGASGAIAAVLGAFAVRFATTQMRFAYFFFIGFRILRGTFEAPAWVMLGVWFANELLQAWWSSAGGLSDGVAYWAHVGGFACGAGAAFALIRSGVLERYIEPKLEEKITLARGNPVVQQALEARERGEAETAWSLLEAEARRAPRDPDVQLAFWDAAVACGRAAEAAPGFARFVRGLAAGGELAQAARAWSELVHAAPDALADPPTLVKLFPALREADDPERAKLALRHAVDPRATGVTAGTLLRVVELARSFDPPSALRAARRALAVPDLDEAKRARLAGLVAELEGQGVTEVEAQAPPDGPPRPGRGGSDASAAQPTRAGARDPGAESAMPAERPARPVPIEITLDPELATDRPLEIVRDEATPPPLSLRALAGWSEVKVSEASPVALREEGIVLELSPERRVLLAWSKLQGLAVAGVRDLGPKPVLLLDLLLNWNDFAGEGPLKLVRLRSDRFDARRLAPGSTSQTEALRLVVSLVLERSGATPLPDPESARGRPFRVYDAVAAYQREMLQVEG
jgi:membrane associated rhomboid family serine protease